MQPLSARKRASLFTVTGICCIFLLSSMNVFCQKGHHELVKDNTYGKGGEKFEIKFNNLEVDIVKDPNHIRREETDLYTFGKGKAEIKDINYYGCNNKMAAFKSESLDDGGKLIQEIREIYKNGARTGYGWMLKDGKKIEELYNEGLHQYQPTAGLDESFSFKPDYSSCAKINLGLKKPVFNFPLIGAAHYKTTEPDNVFHSGTVNIEAFEVPGLDYDVELYSEKDANGVIRHSEYREYYSDGCEYVEESDFDCHGVQTYYGYSWYDEDGYEYKCLDEYYKGGEPVRGYKSYEDWDGYTYHRYYNPKTDEYERDEDFEQYKDEDYEPDLTDCPPRLEIVPNPIYVGPSFIREDNGTDHFFTYGVEASYTRSLCPRGGITGDVGVNFGSNSGTTYTKLTALAGGTYYPFKTAIPADPFDFSIHALAGVTNIHSSYSSMYGGYSNSSTGFALDLGVGFDYNLSKSFGVGARLGYDPTFIKGNTSSNFRLSLGIEFK